MGDAAEELSIIAEQYPVEPLQYLAKTPRISFEEGIKMLQEAGFEVGAAHHVLGLLDDITSFMRVCKHCQKARRLPCTYGTYCQCFWLSISECTRQSCLLLQPDVLGDLTRELERELGRLVKIKYKTDFYALYRYPLAVRPLMSLTHPVTEPRLIILDMQVPCFCMPSALQGTFVCDSKQDVLPEHQRGNALRAGPTNAGAALLHNAGP